MTITNFTQKVREKLSQLPLEYRYLVERANYSRQLPKLNKDDLKIVKKLRQEGIYITHLEDLEIPTTDEFLKATKELASKLVHPTRKNSFFLRQSFLETIQYPEVFLWGIQERILKIVEHYI
ncbi:MAG: hypothetical protein ACOC0N_10920, partial [Chroococcales cyanobacterium]